MMYKEDKYLIFIITGMHRSGTSLTSSLMESAGVNVGERLMGALTGNSKGHFENLDFVEFHQRILNSLGISQDGWTLQKEISVPQQLRDQSKLIIEKNSVSHLWGWKDPRTTLFLDFWEDLLPQAYFIFTYRSPWEVVDSLYRRGDEIFYNNPKYALEMWIHYNTLILDFYNRFSNKSILLNIDNLITDCNLISKLCQDKFGIELRIPNENIVEDSLMSRLSEGSHRPLLIKSISPEAIELFENLNSRSDVKCQSLTLEYLETISNESCKDWILQDWLNVSRISKQMQQSKSELQRSQTELQRSQTELQRSQTELQEAFEKWNEAQKLLRQSHEVWERSQIIIQSMENSKFWKIRKLWVSFKQLFNQTH